MRVLLGTVALLAVCAGSAKAAGSGGGEGTLESRKFSGVSGTQTYLVYLPPGFDESARWPLVVLLHGCGANAETEMNADEVNPIADRERFVVVYPNNRAQGETPSVVGQAPVANGSGCWGAFNGDRTDQQRGLEGDADIVAGMTRTAIADYGIDTERVYLVGMSSGGFQTSATASSYPELFAAAGVSAGGAARMDFSCTLQDDSVVPEFAQRTVQAMGERKRIMPFFSIGGTGDPLGEASAPGGCSRMAFKSWIAADNLIAGGPRYSVDPAATQKGMVEGGYSWTREVATDKAGCQIGERWIVDGLGHSWSGGSSDPQWVLYNDPMGPDAGEAVWRFFKQFTLSGTNTSCPAPTASVAFRGARARGSVRLVRGRVMRLRVTCPTTAAQACRGRVTLRRGARLLANAAFTIDAGRTSTVTARLTKAGRRFISTHRTFRATERISAKDGRGRGATSSKVVRVRRGGRR